MSTNQKSITEFYTFGRLGSCVTSLEQDVSKHKIHFAGVWIVLNVHQNTFIKNLSWNRAIHKEHRYSLNKQIQSARKTQLSHQ